LTSIQAALAQTWPPFVLVSGLLLIGRVAGGDGLFDAAAARIARLPGGTVVLLLACYALVALVTAVLNLDTAAVFLTPVLLGVARRRHLDMRPFLYGTVFMVNASSLFLPGSNLTNLLVLSGRHVSGGAFLTRMLPLALAAMLACAGGLLLIYRHLLASGAREADEQAPNDRTPFTFGAGFWGVLAGAVLMLVLTSAALPVLAIGLSVASWRLHQGRLVAGDTLRRLGLPVLASLFCLAVALGTLARLSGFPGDALNSASAPVTAVVAAIATVIVNNLPAAVLLSAGTSMHPGAMLLGLNVGPNLAVTGSLSVLLWWRAARDAGARPSARAYSRQGLVLVPGTLTVALLVGALTGSS
jgi:arsenical pump membrane protein